MNLLRWIDGLWVLGVGVLSMRSIGGWWLIQRLRATAIDEAPDAVQAQLCEHDRSDALGIRRETLLRISSAVAGPITIGALRTMVPMPALIAQQLLCSGPTRSRWSWRTSWRMCAAPTFSGICFRLWWRRCSSFIRRYGGSANRFAMNANYAAMISP